MKRKRKENDKKKREKEKTRINKSMALVAHTYASTLFSTSPTDSGNESNSNSFIALLSDISVFHANAL